MGIHQKLYRFCLFLIITAFIAGMVLTYVSYLAEPIVLPSYQEIRVRTQDNPENPHLRIHYITNAEDWRVVEQAYFPKFPEIVVQASEFDVFGSGWNFQQGNRDDIPGQTVGRYRLRTVYINIDAHSLSIEELNELILKEVALRFNNGDQIVAELGEFIFYNVNLQSMEHFIGRGNAASSDGQSDSWYEVKEPITLVGINTPLLSRVERYLSLSINGVDHMQIQGMIFEEGDMLHFKSLFMPPQELLDRYTSYKLHPKMIYETKDGTQHELRFYNVDYSDHSFDFIELRAYLKERGAMQ